MLRASLPPMSTSPEEAHDTRAKMLDTVEVHATKVRRKEGIDLGVRECKRFAIGGSEPAVSSADGQLVHPPHEVSAVELLQHVFV